MATKLAVLAMASALLRPRADGIVDGLDGEDISVIMPAVLIGAYERCDEAAWAVREEDAVKDMHGKACAELDQDWLTSLGVDDCAGVSTEASHMTMTFICLDNVTQSTLHGGSSSDADTLATACTFKKGVDLADCGVAMDAAVKSFAPEPLAFQSHLREEFGDAPFELALGCALSCNRGLEPHFDDSDVLAQIKKHCSQDTDPTSMEAMGVRNDDCMESAKAPFRWVSSYLCTAECLDFHSLTDPTDPNSQATREDLDASIDTFIDKMEKEGLYKLIKQHVPYLGLQREKWFFSSYLYPLFGRSENAGLMPSVYVAAFKKCDEASWGFHEEDAVKVTMPWAWAPCRQLDQDRMTALGVRSCANLSAEATHWVMTLQCLQSVIEPQNPPSAFEEACVSQKGGKLAGCKAAIDQASSEYDPRMMYDISIQGIDQSGEEKKDVMELMLGFAAACDRRVESHLENSMVAALPEFVCSQDTDPASMKAMGVHEGDCVESVRAPFRYGFVGRCVLGGMEKVDYWPHATREDFDDFVDDSVESMVHKSPFDALVFAKQWYLGAVMNMNRLRLYSVVKDSKYLSPLRKSAPALARSLAAVVAVAAALASALVTFGLVWRRRGAARRQGDEEAELELVA